MYNYIKETCTRGQHTTSYFKATLPLLIHTCIR